MASIVPIFNESGSFIGIWAHDRAFEPSPETLEELRGLARPTLRALTNIPYERVENFGLIRVGENIGFEDGVFLMISNERPPAEAVKLGASFVAVSYHGVPIAKRESPTQPEIKPKSFWRRLGRLFGLCGPTEVGNPALRLLVWAYRQPCGHGPWLPG